MRFLRRNEISRRRSLSGLATTPRNAGAPLVSDANNPGVAGKLEKLTPAQRALLERRLMERRTDAARRNTISPREGRGPSVLSNSQELLWLLSQVFDDGIAYNAPGAFHLEGSLDLDVLRRCFEALIERHEILRTTYTVVDGRPMQEVGPTSTLDLNVVDLRDHPPEQREAEAQKVLKDESRFAFDLVNGPVMRSDGDPAVGQREHPDAEPASHRDRRLFARRPLPRPQRVLRRVYAAAKSRRSRDSRSNTPTTRYGSAPGSTQASRTNSGSTGSASSRARLHAWSFRPITRGPRYARTSAIT